MIEVINFRESKSRGYLTLTLDTDKERVSLGLKQLSDNPWADIESKYPINSRVKGALEAAGIEIPYNYVNVVFSDRKGNRVEVRDKI